MRLVIIILFIIICFLVPFFYFFGQKVKPFFDTYEKVIAGISYAAVVLGLLLTMAQIRAGNRQAKANATFEVHSTGRALRMSIDENILNYIQSPECTAYSEDIKHKGEMKIHEILMFCASVYHQRNFQMIEERYFKKVFLKEVRTFLNHPRVKKYWKDNISSSEMWDKGFKKLCETRLLN